MPFASWKFSGLMTAGAGATVGYATDRPNALFPTPVAYPRGVTTPNCKLTLNVSGNALIVTATTFTIYRNGVATGLTLVYAAGVTGIQHIALPVGFAADLDTLDLRVDNPGALNDAGLTVNFSADVEFY